MSANSRGGRLSIWAAAMVVARRDIVAILFSRSFIFFLIGPLFPVVVGTMAGGIGQTVQQSTQQPRLGVAMQAADAHAMLAAREAIAPRMGGAAPELVAVKSVALGEHFDPGRALADKSSKFGAILTGSPAHPLGLYSSNVR